MRPREPSGERRGGRGRPGTRPLPVGGVVVGFGSVFVHGGALRTVHRAQGQAAPVAAALGPAQFHRPLAWRAGQRGGGGDRRRRRAAFVAGQYRSGAIGAGGGAQAGWMPSNASRRKRREATSMSKEILL